MLSNYNIRTVMTLKMLLNSLTTFAIQCIYICIMYCLPRSLTLTRAIIIIEKNHPFWRLKNCLKFIYFQVYLIIGLIGRLAGEEFQGGPSPQGEEFKGGPSPQGEREGGPFIQFRGNSRTVNTFRANNGEFFNSK